MLSFPLILEEVWLIHLFVFVFVLNAPSKCPGKQGDVRPDHLAGAEKHVCRDEGAAQPTGDPFCVF